MKKLLFAVGILLISLSASSTAYAGTINDNEAQIIDAARAEYEYNGVIYKADPAYVNQLIDYLSADDVDLNAEERDQVLQYAFQNVETGVLEGYLLPIEGQQEQGGTGSESDSAGQGSGENTSGDASLNNPTDTPMDNQAGSEIDTSIDTSTETSADTPADTSEDTSSAGTDTQTGNSEDTDTGNSGNDTSSGGDNTSDSSIVQDNGTEPSGNSTEQKDAVITGQDKVPTPEELVQNALNGTPEESTASIPEETIIKNTGFNFNNTVILLVGLGMLMLSGIIVTMKSNYFAHKNE